MFLFLSSSPHPAFVRWPTRQTPTGPEKGPFPPTTLLLSFSLLARLWHTPSFLLAPGPRPIPTLFPTGPVKGSALADWFLYLKPIPRARLTHRPDDGCSKDLWTDYMALQPRRQLSSYSPPWEPQIQFLFCSSKTVPLWHEENYILFREMQFSTSSH
jgi:hypothetical protein